MHLMFFIAVLPCFFGTPIWVPDQADLERKAVALADLTAGFNYIAGHAAEFRRLMTTADAEAFDAVVEDIMAALLAIPEIALKNQTNAETIRPRAPRPERLPQVIPDLTALDRFFGRIQVQYSGKPESKLLSSARAAIKKSLRAFSTLQPTVSATGRDR